MKKKYNTAATKVLLNEAMRRLHDMSKNEQDEDLRSSLDRIHELIFAAEDHLDRALTIADL